MRKEKNKYYFTVEGRTEKWYLDWLQQAINSDPSARYIVQIDSKTEKDPLRRVKSLSVLEKTDITHLCDYESNDPAHVSHFVRILDRMKAAQSSGKSIQYKLAYSNFTFELWMVLHKVDSRGLLSDRNQYLSHINRAYTEQFESLVQYKQESNFCRLLSKLTLNDVKQAIQRSKGIMQRNEANGYVLQRYKGYSYYRENPSLSVWEAVEKILVDCDLLQQ